MEEDFPESSLSDELQCSKTEAAQESLQDLNLDQSLQDQNNPQPSKRPESPQHQDQEQQSVQVRTQDEEKEDNRRPPDSPEEQLEVQRQKDGCDRAPGDEFGVFRQDQTVDLDTVSPQDQDVAGHQGHTDSNQDHNQDQDLSAAANQEAAAAGESGGSVPALVVTQAEESVGAVPAAPVEPAVSPVEPRRPQRPADLVIPLSPTVPTEPSLSSSSDGGDMTCCDLLSLRSDSLSLTGDVNVCRTNEDDDSTSVTASSVMSLFQRVQLDPLEKDWLRSSAVGNLAAQRRLIAQECSLVLKKTALHWAAKQGRQEAVDMMLRSGADVNVRSGYTALHLASIHGHQHIVHALIHTYNARTNIRDYHGKTAAHYWSGCTDVFNKPDCQSGGRFYRGRQTQRYGLPSLLLSRSRSQGQLNLDFGTLPPSASHDALDLQL